MKLWVVYEFNHKHQNYHLAGCHSTFGKAQERFMEVLRKRYLRRAPSSRQVGVKEMKLRHVTAMLIRMVWWHYARGGVL